MKTRPTITYTPALAVSILLISALAANAVPKKDKLPPLIPRSIILADSERGNPVLSPDGKMIAYSALYRGVQNIWAKTVGKDDGRAEPPGEGEKWDQLMK